MAENQPWFVAAFYHLALDNACNALLTTFRIRTYTTNPRSLIYPSSRFIQLLLIKFYRWLKYELTNQGLPMSPVSKSSKDNDNDDNFSRVDRNNCICASHSSITRRQFTIANRRTLQRTLFLYDPNFFRSVRIYNRLDEFFRSLSYRSLISPKKMATSVSRTFEYHCY